jgi:hypothetical protein
MRVTLTSHKVRLWRLAWVVISLMASVSFPEGVGAVEIRAWQFHAPDWGYVRRVLAKTAEYDINTVVFSHEIVGFVSELYDGSDRADSLRAVAEDARSRGLRVWIWLHELEHDVPSAFLNDGVVDFDNPALWTWLDEKYERLFNDFPAFDGIQLTFSQTPYPLFDNLKVRSPLSVADRFARLINALATVCDRHEKDLVVRSFLGEPEQLEWFRQAIGQAPPDVTVQSKCVPFDWQPFFPHNPLLGAFPERRQVVEFDCSSEYHGEEPNSLHLARVFPAPVAIRGEAARGHRIQRSARPRWLRRVVHAERDQSL